MVLLSVTPVSQDWCVAMADLEVGRGGGHFAPAVGHFCPAYFPTVPRGGCPYSHTGGALIPQDVWGNKRGNKGCPTPKRAGPAGQ